MPGRRHGRWAAPGRPARADPAGAAADDADRAVGERLTTSIADGDSLRYYPASTARPRPLPPQAPARPGPMQLLLVQRADGGLTVGDTHAYEEPFDFAVARPRTTTCASGPKGCSACPAVVRRRWAGVYARTTRGDRSTASAGAVEPGVIVVTGLAGRGMTRSPAIAGETYCDDPDPVACLDMAGTTVSDDGRCSRRSPPPSTAAPPGRRRRGHEDVRTRWASRRSTSSGASRRRAAAQQGNGGLRGPLRGGGPPASRLPGAEQTPRPARRRRAGVPDHRLPPVTGTPSSCARLGRAGRPRALPGRRRPRPAVAGHASAALLRLAAGRPPVAVVGDTASDLVPAWRAGPRSSPACSPGPTDAPIWGGRAAHAYPGHDRGPAALRCRVSRPGRDDDTGCGRQRHGDRRARGQRGGLDARKVDLDGHVTRQ